MNREADLLLQTALADARAYVEQIPVRDVRAGVRARVREATAPRTSRRSSPFRRAALLGLAATIMAVGAVGAGLALRHVTFVQTAEPGIPIGNDWIVGRGWQAGRAVELDEATANLAAPLVLPHSLGAPDDVYLRQIEGVEIVTVKYDPRRGYPAGGGTGPGVMLVHLSGALYNVDMTKNIPDGAEYRSVDLDGVPAVWIGARFHVFEMVSTDGRHLRQSISADTLVWEVGGAVYRLESRAGLDGARALALEIVRQLRAPPA